MELEKQQAAASNASGIVQTASGPGCQCTTRFDSNMLHWTFTRQGGGFRSASGAWQYRYVFKANCRKCRKVPPPATKSVLEKNLYGTNINTSNCVSISASARTTWASFQQQRKDLESKLLKSFVEGDESLLRETELTGMCLGHDVTARWAHPLWSREDVSCSFVLLCRPYIVSSFPCW